MHYNIFELKDYANHTIKKMDYLLSIIRDLKLERFTQDVLKYKKF